ncbi:UDP-N-acetylmuramoyl-L-alanine--D-glutamate ligase [Methanobrevibacter smithii]|uniref:UDP-N-acetylmuramoyl-L-alanine--D-glutamate ligase n=1 Tax=Methanobrevibacter smithii TaxID=2173 RepID=UPI0037DDB135
MPKNKKVFILGMAKSGYEAAKLLSKDNKVLITDMKEQNKQHVEDLISRGVEYVITNKPEELLDDSYDMMVKNPGILPTHKCVQKARELNIKIINEVELAYSYLPHDIKIIGITGSNGKTTTTTLVYEFLKAAKKSVCLGGNIGYPLCSLVDKIKPEDILLLEISDHQLVDMYDFKCNISALLNLSETHLDLHGTYDNYKKAKKKIFNNQIESDIAILNYDDKEVMQLTSDVKVQKKYFSVKEKKDVYIENDIIKIGNFELNTKDIKLKGIHNYENIMAALLIIDTLGIDLECTRDVLKNFNGVEHRIEFVREINGVTYYNDSKSTNPVATITALNTFTNPTILLLGGFERNQNFNELSDYLGHVKCIICYGETKNRIKEFADKQNIKCFAFDSLKESIQKAVEISERNDTVLLSPASASWDQYDNFETRGNEFKETIWKLEE